MPGYHSRAGLAAPPEVLDGLTEIRVHGVGGATPQSLLGDPSPRQVAGDRLAGFYRTSDAAGRHREAYSWGGLTSHSRLRALWALLLPSMFANMAGWMARRTVTAGPDEASEAPTTWAFRWCARLAALALTVVTTVMTCLLLLDVVSYQCGGSDACRPAGFWSTAADAVAPTDRPGNRLVVGAAAAVLVALAFSYLARQTRRSYERVEPPTVVPPTGPAAAPDPQPSRACAAALPGGLRNEDFWSGLHWHLFLSRLHLTAALGVIAAMLGWSAAALGAGGASEKLGRTAAVLAGVAVLAVIALLRLDAATHAWATVALAAACASLALAVAAGLVVPSGAGEVGMLPGARASINVLWGLGLVLLLPLAGQQSRAYLQRRRAAAHDDGPAVFPWAAPFVVSTTGLIVANTVLVSLVVFVARWLGTVTYAFGPSAGEVPAPDAIYLPKVLGLAATMLTLGLIAALVLFGVGMAVAFVRAGRVDAEAVEHDLRTQYEEKGIGVPIEGAARSEAAWLRSAFDPPMFETGSRRAARRPVAWVRSVARWRFLGRSTHTAAFLLIAITAVAVAAVVAVLVWVWIVRGAVPLALVNAGTTVAVLLPPLFVGVLAAAWRREQTRKLLGTLFDVGSFFPRAFHPFAPPAYAERAVPELTRRVWHLHDGGGQVVLVAHSQGSVIAAAVAGRSSSGRRADEPTLGLVTLGSPLAKLYGWAFPALFSDGFLEGIAGGDPGVGAVRWTNVYYDTDYIGGPIRTEGSVDDGADTGRAAARVFVDVRLVDPPTFVYVADQPLPRVLSHTGYWVDDAFWRRVDCMCAEIAGTSSAALDGVPDEARRREYRWWRPRRRPRSPA